MAPRTRGPRLCGPLCINRAHFIRSHTFSFFLINKKKKGANWLVTAQPGAQRTQSPQTDITNRAEIAFWFVQGECLFHEEGLSGDGGWIAVAGRPIRRSQSEPGPCKLGCHHATHQRPSAQRPASNGRGKKDSLSAFTCAKNHKPTQSQAEYRPPSDGKAAHGEKKG